MEKTKVVNKMAGERYDVYIGRGSVFGNPFTHKQGTKAQFIVGSRDEAVAAYRKWVVTQPEIMSQLHTLKGKTLACYCKPAACHGDVLAEMADALTDASDESGKSVIHISLTGHRPQKLGGYDLGKPGYIAMQRDLEQYIEKNLAVYGVVWGHSGLALGADTIWSKAILAMKKKHPERVKFHAEIPMLEQPDAWFKKSDIDFWHEQVENADAKSIYGSLEGESEAERKYLAVKFLNLRNDGMLDHANVLLAIHDGSKSGTENALKYAAKIGLKTITVHPSVYFG